MIDFDADGGGVDGAGFARVFAVNLQFRSGTRRQKAEGIEIALEVSPLAVSVEYTFTLWIVGMVR